MIEADQFINRDVPLIDNNLRFAGPSFGFGSAGSTEIAVIRERPQSMDLRKSYLGEARGLYVERYVSR
jgi:hypothetical protein